MHRSFDAVRLELLALLGEGNPRQLSVLAP
jgi:hypothetical protein